MSKKPKFKLHLHDSPTTSFCGRNTERGTGWREAGWKPLPHEAFTDNAETATCYTCIRAAKKATS